VPVVGVAGAEVESEIDDCGDDDDGDHLALRTGRPCSGSLYASTYADNLERNVVDARAIASGRRRASIEQYRAAQQAVARPWSRP